VVVGGDRWCATEVMKGNRETSAQRNDDEERKKWERAL
jgi:hypothetical protein